MNISLKFQQLIQANQATYSLLIMQVDQEFMTIGRTAFARIMNPIKESMSNKDAYLVVKQLYSTIHMTIQMFSCTSKIGTDNIQAYA
jgi:hypothetical protein